MPACMQVSEKSRFLRVACAVVKADRHGCVKQYHLDLRQTDVLRGSLQQLGHCASGASSLATQSSKAKIVLFAIAVRVDDKVVR